MFVRVIDDFFANLDVLIEGFVAGIDHHGSETFIDAFLAEFEGISVIQVDGDGDIGKADGGFDQFLKIDRIGILARI